MSILTAPLSTRCTVSLQRHELPPPFPSSLWELSQVVALDSNGKQVGFLRISYIPKHKTTDWHDLYAFLRDHSLEGLRVPRRDTPQAWRDFLWSARLKLFSYSQASHQHTQSDGCDVTALKAQAVALKPLLEDKLSALKAEFVDFHVDKPMVDYIEVVSDWRQKRVGMALYQEAARWMGERNLQLHSSGIQTPEAQRVWDKLSNNNWTDPETCAVARQRGKTRLKLR